MWRDNTIIVEITGIMGAGYLPGFLKSLSLQLEGKYLRDTPDGFRPLVSYYHVDNSAALNADRRRRDRIDALIGKAPNLSPPEWQELRSGLAWADELLRKKVEEYRRAVDVVFRRGGFLQTYVLLKGRRWEEATINRRLRPKLPVFLTAGLSTITHTFAEDPDMQKVVMENPNTYCRSAEHAYSYQEEWLSQVKDLQGVIVIERSHRGKEAFAETVIARILPMLQHYNLKTIPRRHLFISYAAKDFEFVDKLEMELQARKLRIWIDKREIKVGDSLIEKISEGIESSAYAAVIISRNSVGSRWVQKELEILVNRNIEGGQRNILPLVIESGLTLPVFLQGIRYLDFAIRGFEDCMNELVARVDDFD